MEYKQKQFTRQCPNCEKEIIYKNYRSYLECNRKKRLCRSCAAKEKIKNLYEQKLIKFLDKYKQKYYS